MRVVTAPAIPAAYSACSLPLRARRPRSFRRRDSAPFVRPYRPGASCEFPALHPAPTGSPDMIPCRRCCKGGGAPNPVCCPAVFLPPSPLRDRLGTELSF
ncbi:hypothetical protein NDU88_004720 [Pleurodeles waltl]|uniref:Uncharacterized protein n=1 Tax=Pleurodeles waltl TaxID=8319 RepID=A0AAV7NUJ5_PLEWA|nr:hypothetical protein NDU88_004720 [Pleurodeles waltl]